MKRILILMIAAFAFNLASAQQLQVQNLPADPALRKGVLENGLTYYIRHNEKPRGQADFYILHNVGAIQENDSQQGLAHFLEHMAFNGTRNLPGKQLTEYLETVGVKFGVNLNAATTWDYTMYNITDVPTARQSVVDSVLLILHDWSHFIALEPKEIDSERGVIMEELRTRDGAEWRSNIRMIKALGKGTLYEHRNLIGYLEDLKSFQHKHLEAFYNKWYRPDYQAIVIVGDIDVDRTEANLKALMADIPAPAADAAKKAVITVPENEEPIISIYADPEMQGTSVSLFLKHNALPAQYNNTDAGLSLTILKAYISLMANARLQEISTKPDPPFLGANFGIGSTGIIPTLEVLLVNAMTKDDRLGTGIEAIYTELERIRRHGFTQGEFERAQADLISSIESSYKNRNDKRNSQYVTEYISNYQNNTPVMDAENEYRLQLLLVKNLQVEIINQSVKELISPKNQVITVNMPEKEGVVIPTEAEILAIRDKVMKSEVEAYKDDVVKVPLIGNPGKLKGSPVKKTEKDEVLGTTTWTLKNGAKVVVKPTEFEADGIYLSVYAKGGLALLSEEDLYMGSVLPALNSLSGVSRFSMTELKKQLSGVNAAVSTGVENYLSTMSGACSPQYLENMLQLLYLNFTEPRFNRDDYNNLHTLLLTQLKNLKSNPNYRMQEEVNKAMFGNHPRRQQMSEELLSGFDFERFPNIYSTLYPGANGFTFLFVGNVDPNVLKPLAEKYIGSIPCNRKPIAFKDDHVRPAPGRIDREFKVAMEQPKVSVFYAFSDQCPATLKDEVALSFLTEALNSRYLVSIREEKGGTYGVGVQGSSRYLPEEGYNMVITFDTNEKMADELMEIVLDEFRKIAEEGPEKETVEKHREYLLKQWGINLEHNEAWMQYIKNSDIYGVDVIGEYEKTVRGLECEDVQMMARKILNGRNRLKVVMRPEK